MISLTQPITDCICNIASITRVHNSTVTQTRAFLIMIYIFGIKMANFYQQFLKPLGSYKRVVTITHAEDDFK